MVQNISNPGGLRFSCEVILFCSCLPVRSSNSDVIFRPIFKQNTDLLQTRSTEMFSILIFNPSYHHFIHSNALLLTFSLAKHQIYRPFTPCILLITQFGNNFNEKIIFCFFKNIFEHKSQNHNIKPTSKKFALTSHKWKLKSSVFWMN